MNKTFSRIFQGCFTVQLSRFFVVVSCEATLIYYHMFFRLSTTFFKFFWFFSNLFSFIFTGNMKRRRRDLNPRTAINDLLPFQGSPFSRLGTSPCAWITLAFSCLLPSCAHHNLISGEGGIRTHAPFRTNGFQDRLVMTTSIPLHYCTGDQRI